MKKAISSLLALCMALSLAVLPVSALERLTGCACCCDACFTGRYPTAIPADTRKDRFERKLSEREEKF